MAVKPGCNTKKPALHIRYYDLPADTDGWARHCPACKEGTLGVTRDPRTYVIKSVDRCLLCGQTVNFVDVNEMRRKDGNPPPPPPAVPPTATEAFLKITTMVLKAVVGLAIMAGALCGWYFFKADGFLMFILGMCGLSLVGNALGVSFD